VTLLCYGPLVRTGLESAAAARGDGRSVEVVDLRSLSPLDMDTITASVRKTGRCVIVEIGWPVAGFGAEIAYQMQRVCMDSLDAPIERVTSDDVPMPYAANLEKLALPSVDEVVEAAKAVCYR